MAVIVGISGSLRKASYNSALLRAAAEVAPEGTTIEIGSIRELPLYDADVEAQAVPPPVAALKDHFARADGILLATPEYNHSIPGTLKNAIDWLSRPPRDIERVFEGKPVAIMGATPGRGMTLHAQAAWLPVLHTLGLEVWSGGDLAIGEAGKVFDVEGRITDEKMRERLVRFVSGFAAFVEQVRKR